MAGTGFIGEDEWIGLCQAKYQWGGPWKPVDGYKHTLCGNVFIKKKKNIFKNNKKNNSYHLISDGDGDLVFYTIPDSSFQSLLINSFRPQGHFFKDFSLSCEVALKESGQLLETNAETFFKNISIDSIQNKPVGVYGSWVSDIHHEKSPEIHPIQQMWSVEQRQNNVFEYQLYSLFDNSGRFDDKKDFAESCFLKPWITVPLINCFYIPFTISINENSQLVYDVSISSSNNINLYETVENKLRLVLNGKLKLFVKKSVNTFPLISFFDVCQIDANTIHGYLKIETSIGNVQNKSGAHAFLKMVLSKKDFSE